MSSSPYNCTGPFPPISVNPDITCHGVVANYVATAGIAVLLIIVYFFASYEPLRDPLRKTGRNASRPPFRPNPVDQIILRTLRRLPKRLVGSGQVQANNQLERSFIKCILAMSDLQIITGISILISGFVQLRQGLSAYHWMVIVDLAWFSSVTHMACLTLLRNYLYNHPLQRMWRLFSMGGLVTLLVIALSFTGNPVYGWAFLQEFNSEVSYHGATLTIYAPALCQSSPMSRSDKTYRAMVFSIVLIIFGFVTRAIKLSKIISIDGIGRGSEWLNTRLRCLLRAVSTWCVSDNSHKSLKRTLIYRPLLAIFLIIRLLLDGWSSMFLEVGWLIVGFLWGIFRLTAALSIEAYLFKARMMQDSGTSNGAWGFGQVVAIVLLVAPVISIVEYFDHGAIHCQQADTSINDRTYAPLPAEVPLISLAVLPLTYESPRDLDDLDNGWDGHVETLGTATLYVIAMCAVIVSMVCFYTAAHVNVLEFIKSLHITLIIATLGLYEMILFSLTIETHMSTMPSWSRKLLHLINILFFMASAFFSYLIQWFHKIMPGDSIEYYSLDWIGTYSFLISATVFYNPTCDYLQNFWLTLQFK